MKRILALFCLLTVLMQMFCACWWENDNPTTSDEVTETEAATVTDDITTVETTTEEPDTTETPEPSEHPGRDDGWSGEY